jgi:hypothetical protein
MPERGETADELVRSSPRLQAKLAFVTIESALVQLDGHLQSNAVEARNKAPATQQEQKGVKQ